MSDRTGNELSPDICNSRVILFLGAGASAALGLKLMGSFMDLLESNLPEELVPVLENIYEGPGAGRDLELVFDAIERYRNMQDYCEGEPNWNSAVGGRIANIQQLVQRCDDIRNHAEDLVVRHYSAIDADKVVPHYHSFITLLAKSNEASFLPIFTTNYDTAIEDLVDNSSDTFQLVDGFSIGRRRQWAPDSMFHAYRAKPVLEPAIILFKLHGSSTWYRHKRTGRITNAGSMSVRLRDNPDYENVLVWPGRTKQIQEGPHEVNYRYLKECLRRARLCVVIGFSFRDEIIKGYFEEALVANRELCLVIVDPEVDSIISEHPSFASARYRRRRASGVQKLKPPYVYGVRSKYGASELPGIETALATLDFTWDPGASRALAGKAAQRGTRTGGGTEDGDHPRN